MQLTDLLPYTVNLKLLYVEDDSIARELTTDLLKELFHTVVVAVDGRDGVEKYHKHQIDLILTDITMPHMDGFEMIEEIRKTEEHMPPVMMLSAYTNPEYFIRAIESGMDAYILKPFNMEKFLSSLHKVVSKLKILDEARESINLLKQYQVVVDSSSIVSKTDVNGFITYVNDAFCDISGYEREELIGKNHNIIRHPAEPSELFEDMWDTIKGEKRTWCGVIKNLKKDGSSYYVKATISPILDKDGNVIEYIALRDDISDIMNQQREFDNSFALLQEPVIIYMKLEDFSTVEDFYNTEMVHLIQEKVKIFLENEMLAAGVLYGKLYPLRYGEYAVAFEKSVLPFEMSHFIRQLKIFHEKIKNQIVIVKDLQYQISLLMSVAYKHNNILESARIGIKKLHYMKQDFIISNNFAHFEKLNAQKNLETIATIKNAIQNGGIVSHFQPIIENKTQKITRYESLVRLVNESGDILFPGEFLDIARKGKYYYQITQIVLQNSFKALENNDINIAINLSLKDIYSNSIRKTINALLKEYAEYADRITFELLEDANVKNFKTIVHFIDQIKEMGVKIAIDDFGSGYSNYERLLSYRPDILKIDGSLIKNLDKNKYSRSIVKTIVSFAKDQNILTTAEFVENEKIFNIVKELGIDYSQGYLFGKSQAL
jgi:PAS domain S-box-containing protein